MLVQALREAGRKGYYWLTDRLRCTVNFSLPYRDPLTLSYSFSTHRAVLCNGCAV